MTVKSATNSHYRIWLWIAIFSIFLIVHLPKDKVDIICKYGINFIIAKSELMRSFIAKRKIDSSNVLQIALNMKRIIFLFSTIVLFTPVIKSLQRASFLWERQKFKERIINSGIIFFILSFLIIPINLRSAGAHYALMTLSPFETNSGWYYRRLLTPAIAHLLGFQGHFLYYIFSLILTFILIFSVIAFFEFEGIKLNLLHLLSITTSSFVIFNFMLQGFADPLMFILFIVAIIAADNYEARLAIVALTLVVHEASVFILIPLIVFFLPKENALKYVLVIALYFIMLMLSFKLNIKGLMESQVVLNNKLGFDWIIEYPIRYLGGWFFSYKLLWFIIGYAVFKMVETKNFYKALSIISILVIPPLLMLILTVDVSRFVGFGFLGLLFSYSFLIKTGHGKMKFITATTAINIIIPSIYVGTNNGFRTVPGLYGWLCQHSWLHNLLTNL